MFNPMEKNYRKDFNFIGYTYKDDEDNRKDD